MHEREEEEEDGGGQIKVESVRGELKERRTCTCVPRKHLCKSRHWSACCELHVTRVVVDDAKVGLTLGLITHVVVVVFVAAIFT